MNCLLSVSPIHLRSLKSLEVAILLPSNIHWDVTFKEPQAFSSPYLKKGGKGKKGKVVLFLFT